MPPLTRSQTNLEEVEIAPFAHKYLLKRPRILQRSTTSSINIANLSHGEEPTPSNETRRESRASLLEGPAIDNPAVEKREYFQPSIQKDD